MSTLPNLDITGRRRSPATLPGYHLGRPPRNKGLRDPADPPRVEEIVARGPVASGALRCKPYGMRSVAIGAHSLRLASALA